MKSLRILTLILSFCFLTLHLKAQPPYVAKPKLVVQIVVSQMRYDYLERFYDNFSTSGFRAFINEGTLYTNARYDYMQTNTVAGLATLTTGANPATHGVISSFWYDFITGNTVDLIDDYSVNGLDGEAGMGHYSPSNLIAATLGDRLKESSPHSKVLSIASTPSSAIVMGGAMADVYWCDVAHGNWVSSTFYFEKLPHWVKSYNNGRPYKDFVNRNWTPGKAFETYHNTDKTIIDFSTESKFQIKEFFNNALSIFKNDSERFNVASLQYTPFANTMLTQFVREAVLKEQLGQDEHTDLITICYDTPRLIGESFGPWSIELEDMYYKLDEELEELMNFIHTQVKREDVIFVLTSDHGASDTYKEGSRIPMGLFNTDQFKMIMNGFLSAQYEPGNWVIGYHDHQLYLNRNMIYQYSYNLPEVQIRAANFALQFRGVSAAITSTTLQTNYFGDGYGEKIQHSFYPKRSGDIIIDLMPGWIDETRGVVSTSGSLYDYDTHVPLIFMGGGINASRIEDQVDMTAVAPTLARILHITIPNASTGSVLKGVTQQ